MRGPGFWRLLNDADREALTAVARSRVFPAGTVLCMEGEPTTHVFVLLSGWVKVTTVTRDGREVLEALRGEGEAIGEIAGQVTGYRTATVQAIGPVRALIVGARQFGDFLDRHPGAAKAHRQALAERERAANELQRGYALLSGPQRLAGLLLDLTDRPDAVNDTAAATPLPLSQEELASLIGASRSTVTRALHEWRSRRIIGTDQRHIEILDRARLRRIADRLVKEPLSRKGQAPPPPGLRRDRGSLVANGANFDPQSRLVPRPVNVRFSGLPAASVASACSPAGRQPGGCGNGPPGTGSLPQPSARKAGRGGANVA